MPISPNQLAANRANAHKSTGPRTPEGKHRVSNNALKHGLRASHVVVDAGEGRERDADFLQLLADLNADCNPLGTREELLVQEMALCQWRLLRARRAEIGEIRTGLDCLSSDHTAEREQKVRSAWNFLTSTVDLPDFYFGAVDTGETSAGDRFLLHTT